MPSSICPINDAINDAKYNRSQKKSCRYCQQITFKHRLWSRLMDGKTPVQTKATSSLRFNYISAATDWHCKGTATWCMLETWDQERECLSGSSEPITDEPLRDEVYYGWWCEGSLKVFEATAFTEELDFVGGWHKNGDVSISSSGMALPPPQKPRPGGLWI